MNNKVKIYGKMLNKWLSKDERGRNCLTQVEYAFKEYDLYGELVRTGSEDFSAERYHKTFKEAFVWTWDGHKYNRGGHRRFEDQGLIRFNKEQYKELKEYLSNKYPKAQIIELRYF